MVSGGNVLVVSINLDVSTGVDMLVSTLVLSEVPDMFFVELHADAAIIKVPAKARLKISFFIGYLF